MSVAWIPCVTTALAFLYGILHAVYRIVMQNCPQWAMAVIFGWKLVKMILVVGIILYIKYFTELPVKQAALLVMGAYLVTIVAESIYFLYMKKHYEQKK